VHVDEGVVELRLRGYTAATLGPDDTWQEPAEPSATPRPGAGSVTNIPVVAPPAPARATFPPPRVPAVATPDDEEDLYASAMGLLGARKNDEAAAAFHAFVVAHPHATQAEDASFLEAVALARAGRPDAAGLAAERHLTAFPRSFHRKDAAILVARAASQRGDCVAARAAIAPWLDAEKDAEAASALHGCRAAVEGGTAPPASGARQNP
jgi:TolA-binding protein